MFSLLTQTVSPGGRPCLGKPSGGPSCLYVQMMDWLWEMFKVWDVVVEPNPALNYIRRCIRLKQTTTSTKSWAASKATKENLWKTRPNLSLQTVYLVPSKWTHHTECPLCSSWEMHIASLSFMRKSRSESVASHLHPLTHCSAATCGQRMVKEGWI